MSLFYNMNESRRVEEITMKWPVDGYVIPAGTPMSKTGLANNGDAIGILASEARVRYPYPLTIANSIGKKEPKGNLDYEFSIITGGFVNLAEAEAAFGDTYTDAAKEAMTGIKFVDEANPKGFGGGASHWDDLKGKPFGDKAVVETVIFPETQIDGFKQLDPGIYYTEADIPVIPLEVGKSYIVMWDGIRYECSPVDYGNGDSSCWMGNNAIWGETPDTGEPFQIQYYPSTNTTQVYTSSEATSHTVRVTIETETTTPIPKEMLPEPLRFGEEKEKKYTLSAEMGIEPVAGSLYKVSDEVLPWERFVGGKMNLYNVENGELVDSVTITNEDLFDDSDEFLVWNDILLIAMKDETDFPPAEVLLEKGVYFMADGSYLSEAIYELVIPAVITPINEKYLPKPVVFTWDDYESVMYNAAGEVATYEEARNAGWNVIIKVDGNECKPLSFADEGLSVFYTVIIAGKIVTVSVGAGPS